LALDNSYNYDFMLVFYKRYVSVTYRWLDITMFTYEFHVEAWTNDFKQSFLVRKPAAAIADARLFVVTALVVDDMLYFSKYWAEEEVFL